MSGEFGTGKTIFVLAIVVGCFAVLWPKIFYPMLTASVKQPARQVVWRNEANMQFANKLCYLLEEHRAGVQPQPPSDSEAPDQCWAEVWQGCGHELTETKLENVRLGRDTTNLTECLSTRYGLTPTIVASAAPPKVRLRPYLPQTMARPERPSHLHPEVMHPALREKGRALPVRTIEKQARPGPMPGMRPSMGGAGGMVPPPQSKGSGAMGIIMPLYTVGIVVFFVYTIMKVLFKKGADDEKTPKLKDFGMDPEYRKYVFAEEYLDNSQYSSRDQQRRQARDESRARKKVEPEVQPDPKIEDEQLDQLRQRLEDTEKAMERLMCQMGSVTDKLTAAKITEVLSQAQAQAKILKANLDTVTSSAAAGALHVVQKDEVGVLTSEDDLTSSEALTATLSEDNSLPASLQKQLHKLQVEQMSNLSDIVVDVVPVQEAEESQPDLLDDQLEVEVPPEKSEPPPAQSEVHSAQIPSNVEGVAELEMVDIGPETQLAGAVTQAEVESAPAQEPEQNAVTATQETAEDEAPLQKTSVEDETQLAEAVTQAEVESAPAQEPEQNAVTATQETAEDEAPLQKTSVEDETQLADAVTQAEVESAPAQEPEQNAVTATQETSEDEAPLQETSVEDVTKPTEAALEDSIVIVSPDNQEPEPVVKDVVAEPPEPQPVCQEETLLPSPKENETNDQKLEEPEEPQKSELKEPESPDAAEASPVLVLKVQQKDSSSESPGDNAQESNVEVEDSSDATETGADISDLKSFAEGSRSNEKSADNSPMPQVDVDYCPSIGVGLAGVMSEAEVEYRGQGTQTSLALPAPTKAFSTEHSTQTDDEKGVAVMGVQTSFLHDEGSSQTRKASELGKPTHVTEIILDALLPSETQLLVKEAQVGSHPSENVEIDASEAGAEPCIITSHVSLAFIGLEQCPEPATGSTNKQISNCEKQLTFKSINQTPSAAPEAAEGTTAKSEKDTSLVKVEAGLSAVADVAEKMVSENEIASEKPITATSELTDRQATHLIETTKNEQQEMIQDGNEIRKEHDVILVDGSHPVSPSLEAIAEAVAIATTQGALDALATTKFSLKTEKERVSSCPGAEEIMSERGSTDDSSSVTTVVAAEECLESLPMEVPSTEVAQDEITTQDNTVYVATITHTSTPTHSAPSTPEMQMTVETIDAAMAQAILPAVSGAATSPRTVEAALAEAAQEESVGNTECQESTAAIASPADKSPATSKGSSPDMDEYEVVNKD